MVLESAGRPLRLMEVDPPNAARGEIVVRVAACGVCRTDLHVVDGDLPNPHLPLSPGHEIVGRVHAAGEAVDGVMLGERVGIPWLGWSCGNCRFCLSGRENLCPSAQFTGYTLPGGYAEYVACDARFALPIPAGYSDVEAAPLLCAGLIGYRALRAVGDARRLGLYGFGAAAHIVSQQARHEGRDVFAFTRPGDAAAQAFATSLGAVWAGDSDCAPPEPLDAAIIFAPVGSLIPAALQAVERGGTVVCAGIHMSEIPAFSYDLLWGERTLRSVANLTRKDGHDFLALAPLVPIRTETTSYPLEHGVDALDDLRQGRLHGAAVLVL